MKPLGQDATITLTLSDFESRLAIWQIRQAAESLSDARHVFAFLAETVDENFAWDMHGQALTAILRFSSQALSMELDTEPSGLDLEASLCAFSDRLKALKEDADADQ